MNFFFKNKVHEKRGKQPSTGKHLDLNRVVCLLRILFVSHDLSAAGICVLTKYVNFQAPSSHATSGLAFFLTSFFFLSLASGFFSPFSCMSNIGVV